MANGAGSLGLGVDDGLGETSSPLPSAAPVDEVPGATAFPLPPAAPVDEVPGATAFPLPPAAPVDEVPSATAFPLPSSAPVDEGLGATAAPLRSAAPASPLRSAAPASPLRPAAPAPAPGVPPTLDGSAGRHGLPGSRTDSVANGGDSGSHAQGVGVSEGLGATSSPPRSVAPPSRVPLAPDASGRGAGGVRYICDEVVERLVAGDRLDPGAIDVQLRTLLDEHFCKFLQSLANGGDSVPGAQGVGVSEGLGATSSPPHSVAPPSRVPLAPDASGRGVGGGVRYICDEVVERLVAGGRLDPGAIDVQLRTLLDEHFCKFLGSLANGGDSVPGAQGVGVSEGLGATSSPPRSAALPSRVPLAPNASGRGAGGGVRDICNEVVERLVSGGRLDPGAIEVQLRTLLEEHFVRFLEERPDASDRDTGGGVPGICDEVVQGLVAGGRLDPGAIDLQFRGLLEEHFGRLPLSYQQYARVIKAEEVFMHMKLLKEAAEANLLPPLNVQFRTVERMILEATDMYVLKESDGAVDASSTRSSNVHEIVFGYIRSPKLRAQLSSVLAELGLSIMHMHLFTTSDGYFLDVFTVAGWPEKDTVNLVETLQESILTHKRSWLTYSSSSVRTHSSQTGRLGSIRRLQIIKKRKRAERVKQEKIMESFKAILSSFLFPTILAIFTSNFSFSESEKPFFIMFFALGGLLILLAMVLSHGVEDEPGRTVVVSRLTLGAVIYVFSVLMYCLYKFVLAESNQVMDLYSSVVHFILGVVILIMLWEHLFK